LKSRATNGDPGVRCGRREERGAVLLLFAAFAIGLFALAGVLVDLGTARATQQRMQVAAEIAAMEGLRWRDVPSADSEVTRRQAAAVAVARAFDDDLDAGNGDAIGIGAGSTSTVVDGRFGSPAGGLLVPGAPYDPVLELNLQNAPHGDFVAGKSIEPAPFLGPWREDALYRRVDFEPSAPDDSARSPAFLARLRRTRDVEGLDRIAGVSSSGPTLPLTWALGGALQPGGAGAFDPRRDGISVRGTAIANERPALAVATVGYVVDGGVVSYVVAGDPEPAVTGGGRELPAFALSLAGARSLWSAGALVLTAPLAAPFTVVDAATLELAAFATTAPSEVGVAVELARTPPVPGPPPSIAATRTVVVPVYADLAGVRTILAFTPVRAAVVGRDPLVLELTALPPHLPLFGSSAVLPAPAARLAASPPLRSARDSLLADAAARLVLAPVLVR
jgi:hypothetical protein